jgi:beta-lactam-binding protein with PASTA domain
MAKTFTITTTASDSIKTDAKGHAEVAYTVTNTTSRPVRGMAKAAALDSTRQEWLHITGETDRDFAAGSTQQFVVSFDAPPPPAGDPASADKYGFRLVVASATNPDEDFTEGQTIRVELPKVAPPPVSKPFPKWVFIPIGVAVLLVIGVVLWLVLRAKAQPKAFVVPDVVGATQADARQSLETECDAGANCLAVTVSSVADNTVPKDKAVATDPVAGTEVEVGSPVTLVISSGPEANPVETFKLPAVANVAEAAAKASLEKACKKQDGCLQVEVNSVTDIKIPAGMAIRTEPETGTEVEVGGKVKLFVSKGPEKVTIQNVANQVAESAMETLEKSCSPAPCLDVEVNRIADNNVAQGRVIRTQPVAGTVVNAGSKVMLFVSGGTDEVTIPLVRGQSVASARQMLTLACKPAPCLQVTQNNLSDDLVPAGQAIGTNPPRGAAVKIGSAIVLNVSTGPELKLVGSYVKLSEQVARQRIVADGFKVGLVKKITMPFFKSQVTAQDPVAGSKRPKGSQINLTVIGN